MRKRTLLLYLLLSPLAMAQLDPQVALVRQVFHCRRDQWNSLLAQHRELLDDVFFEKCQQRIEWDLEHNQAEDALRFALLADCAAELTGRPAHYRENLI
ncbi:MAG: hypothetical protein U0931_04920 [Vulcanimicrobiota bacterium]